MALNQIFKSGSTSYVALLFFSSGFSSLMLQTSWNRILTQVIGIDFESQIIVVSIFMLGLGLGSIVGGFVTRKLRQPLYFFAGAEIIISFFAFFSDVFLRSAQKYLQELTKGNYGLSSLLIDFAGYSVILLIPILLMGTSLPIVIHAMRNHLPVGIATGTFYGVNLFGAVIGTLVSGIYLLGELGIREVLILAGGINLLLSLGFLILIKSSERMHLAKVKSIVRKDDSYKVPLNIKFLAFSCGLISIGFEILFFRILTFFFGAKSYVFPLALAAFLLHVMIGSLIAAKLLRKRMLVEKSLIFALYATLVLSFIPFLLAKFIFFIYPKYGISSFVLPDSTSVGQLFLVFLVTLILMLCVIPISMAFPLIVSMNSVKDGEEGSAVSATYFLTTLGNFVSTLLIGALLIPRFGVVISFLFLVALIFCLLAILKSTYIPSKWFNSFVLNFSIFFIAIGISNGFYETANYKFEPPVRIHHELNGTILVHPTLDEVGKLNGFRINSGSEPATSFDVFDRGWTQKDQKLDASVAALGRAPSKILIIGVGTGDFLIDVKNYFPNSKIVVVELYDSVIYEMSIYGSPELRAVLKDCEIHILDGARSLNNLDLSLTENRFDLIQIGVSHVTAAGAGNLFTREFLAQASKSLTKGGVISSNAYAPLISMLKADNRSFFIYSSGNGYPADVYITKIQYSDEALLERFNFAYGLICKNFNEYAEATSTGTSPNDKNFIINSNKDFTFQIRDIRPLTYNTLITDHFIFQRNAIPGQVDSRVWDGNFASIQGGELLSTWFRSCNKI